LPLCETPPIRLVLLVRKVPQREEAMPTERLRPSGQTRRYGRFARVRPSASGWGALLACL